MRFALRIGTGRGTIEAEPQPLAAEEPGILPCSALRCTERTGVACEQVDRRSRLCATAWCPEHRHLVAGHVYCAVHAARRAGPPHVETERPARLIAWFATAAEDDIVSFLNELAARVDGTVEAQELRVTGGGDGGRIWQRTWRVRAPAGLALPVMVSCGELTGETIHLSVDGDVIRGIALPPEQLQLPPSRVDLDWLLREVVAPLRFAFGMRANDVDASLAGSAQKETKVAAESGWRWF